MGGRTVRPTFSYPFKSSLSAFSPDIRRGRRVLLLITQRADSRPPLHLFVVYVEFVEGSYSAVRATLGPTFLIRENLSDPSDPCSI